MKRPLILSLTLALLFVSHASAAHELPSSSATLTLRDGLITLDADLDVRSWMESLKHGDLEVMVKTARDQAKTQLVVTIDGKAIPMRLIRFPEAQEIHRLLQRPRHPRGPSPALARVRWEATHAVVDARTIQARFPNGPGPVLVSFIEPQSRLTRAGAVASFQSRRLSQRCVKPPKRPGIPTP